MNLETIAVVFSAVFIAVVLLAVTGAMISCYQRDPMCEGRAP
jgi:hypothetical protein